MHGMSGDGNFAISEEILARERQAAAPVVRAILDRPPSEPPSGWITLGFAYELCDAARDASTAERRAGLARLAIVIAECLGSPHRLVVRKSIAARAWRELANAHRARGRFAQALAALNQAVDIIGMEPVLGYDEALLTLCRAAILADMNQDEAALQLLAEARAQFGKWQVDDHIAECEALYGILTQRTCRPANYLVSHPDVLADMLVDYQWFVSRGIIEDCVETWITFVEAHRPA
jgi:tetratricopeptide (TPR) repeat protein